MMISLSIYAAELGKVEDGFGMADTGASACAGSETAIWNMVEQGKRVDSEFHANI